MKYYLFAKFFQNLSADSLMDTCAGLGIDGPTALIRDGYWVTEDALAETLPAFVRVAQTRGLEVRYADTDFRMPEIEKYEEKIRILKDNGITQFRVGYIAKNAAGHVRDLAEYTRAAAEKTAALAEKIGIQAVIQIHGAVYPHNATAAYMAVKGLNPRYIGIKIDPGNNLCQEGYELFDYQIQLLSEYVAAIGAKDGGMVHHPQRAEEPAKGWCRMFAPAYEGAANYPLIYSELKKIGFNGPAVLMPFYYENEFEKLLDCLKKEIQYFKKIEEIPSVTCGDSSL